MKPNINETCDTVGDGQTVIYNSLEKDGRPKGGRIKTEHCQARGSRPGPYETIRFISELQIW